MRISDWSSYVCSSDLTPLFVYDLNIVKAQVARFRAVMPKAVSLHYAMKANSYGPLLERMARHTDGFDIASGGELDLALQAGVSPDRISFAGPGKRNEELEAAIKIGRETCREKG